VSTVSAVLAALTTLAGATLSGWQAINGPVGSITSTEDRLIAVGAEEVVGDRQFNSMTGQTTSERYVVPVVLSVSLPGTDQQAADAIVLAAYDLFERAVREFPGGSDLSLSASGVQQALPTGEFRLNRQADENGRHAAVRFTVAVIAQNT
jgi:hypothetical protein